MSVAGVVYLIHFDRKLHHAGHYLGWTEDLQSRLEAHHSGRGARLLAAVDQVGITWSVVRTWEGKDRHFERSLKRQKKIRVHCPSCTPGAGRGRGWRLGQRAAAP